MLEDGHRIFASNGERKHREQEAQESEFYALFGSLKPELHLPKPPIGESLKYD